MGGDLYGEVSYHTRLTYATSFRTMYNNEIFAQIPEGSQTGTTHMFRLTWWAPGSTTLQSTTKCGIHQTLQASYTVTKPLQKNTAWSRRVGYGVNLLI